MVEEKKQNPIKKAQEDLKDHIEKKNKKIKNQSLVYQ